MPKIKEILAYISEDKGPNDEGIISTPTPMGWMPLVCADDARAKSYEPLAREIAKQTGKKVKLVRFSTREDLLDL